MASEKVGSSPSQDDLFGVTNSELVELNESATLEKLHTAGGVSGLARDLHVDLETGIVGTSEDLENRRRAFGENKYPEKPSRSYLSFLWNACQDATLVVLTVCAIISLVLGELESSDSGWYDGAGILFAVVLIVFVTSVSDFRQTLQFKGLNAEKANIQLQVIRSGWPVTLSIYDLVVGDIVPLAIGDQVPGDGVLVSGHSLTIDESSMTGESHPRHKDSKEPFLLSGCKVVDGFGTMLITGVGTNTEWGRVMSTLSDDNQSETPLQERLNTLAVQIGQIGLSVAALILMVLLIRFFVYGGLNSSFSDIASELVDIFTISVTILVIAVPEGLPLAVTLSLAYSMGKMMTDKALVRNLAACETMGSATTICSDKTGTLTMNQMTVTRVWIGGKQAEDAQKVDGTEHFSQVLLEGLAQNSTGSIFGRSDGAPPKVTGSPTESALFSWGLKMGMDFHALRAKADIIQVETFNSSKKRAGVVVKVAQSGEVRVHWKGAAEIILEQCTKWAGSDGKLQNMTEAMMSQILADVTDMAQQSLRCIAIAYRPLAASEIPPHETIESDTWTFPDTNLTLLAVVGMKDPCRPHVREAVARCQQAGVKVRMVTGDNAMTAKAIAKECGILTRNGIIMEGKTFRALPESEKLAVIPQIDVLARSSPTDKYTLVKLLRKMGEVVAVTGDGTNDAPALLEADIGLSMGISGTEVAKESSDIVILDDNFASIVKVVRWGRSVYSNIQKFIQFQLTINAVALTTNFVAAASSGEVPLTAVQLLWVNLIMDTFAALALATEPPTDELLDRPPIGRTEPLITNVMWRNIILMGVYQLAVFLTLYYAGQGILGLGNGDEALSINNTIIFNAFVICQLFNEVNCRTLDSLNCFKGIWGNRPFLMIIGMSMVVQVIIVERLNTFASTVQLTLDQWLICIGIGALTLPIGALIKLIPVPDPSAPPLALRWRRHSLAPESSSGHRESGEFEPRRSTSTGNPRRGSRGDLEEMRIPVQL